MIANFIIIVAVVCTIILGLIIVAWLVKPLDYKDSCHDGCHEAAQEDDQ